MCTRKRRERPSLAVMAVVRRRSAATGVLLSPTAVALSRLLCWSVPVLALAACLSPGTGENPEPAPVVMSAIATPVTTNPVPSLITIPTIVPPDPGLVVLRRQYPHPIALDPAGDRDGWFTMARLLADHDALARHFRRVDYDPPAFSRALVVTVRPGVEQPRLFHYSLGDTAFVVPRHYFHPASTVKLAAAIGALVTVGALGLTGDVEIEFTDAEGVQRGRLADMIAEALLHSSNRDYNRLVRIAGFDALNDDLLSARWGLPIMAIQARYGDRDGPTLRSSPVMRWREGERSGELPAREAVGRDPDCKGNCATLFELHEVQRRVMLHEELPASERFPIDPRDVARMRATMKVTRKRLGSVPDELFGAPVEVYNNVGRIPRVALLENATLVDRASGRRVFIVASVAFPGVLGDSDALVVPRLRALVRPTLALALAATPEGPGLQHDAGVIPEVSVHHDESLGLLVELATTDEARVWIDRRPMLEAATGAFTLAQVAAGEHVLVIELGPVAAPTAYRASLLTVPARVATSMQASAPLR